jgi:hypothetical protein
MVCVTLLVSALVFAVVDYVLLYQYDYLVPTLQRQLVMRYAVSCILLVILVFTWHRCYRYNTQTVVFGALLLFGLCTIAGHLNILALQKQHVDRGRMSLDFFEQTESLYITAVFRVSITVSTSRLRVPTALVLLFILYSCDVAGSLAMGHPPAAVFNAFIVIAAYVLCVWVVLIYCESLYRILYAERHGAMDSFLRSTSMMAFPPSNANRRVPQGIPDLDEPVSSEEEEELNEHLRLAQERARKVGMGLACKRPRRSHSADEATLPGPSVPKRKRRTLSLGRTPLVMSPLLAARPLPADSQKTGPDVESVPFHLRQRSLSAFQPASDQRPKHGLALIMSRGRRPRSRSLAAPMSPPMKTVPRLVRGNTIGRNLGRRMSRQFSFLRRPRKNSAVHNRDSTEEPITSVGAWLRASVERVRRACAAVHTVRLSTYQVLD